MRPRRQPSPLLTSQRLLRPWLSHLSPATLLPPPQQRLCFIILHPQPPPPFIRFLIPRWHSPSKIITPLKVYSHQICIFLWHPCLVPTSQLVHTLGHTLAWTSTLLRGYSALYPFPPHLGPVDELRRSILKTTPMWPGAGHTMTSSLEELLAAMLPRYAELLSRSSGNYWDIDWTLNCFFCIVDCLFVGAAVIDDWWSVMIITLFVWGDPEPQSPSPWPLVSGIRSHCMVQLSYSWMSGKGNDVDKMRNRTVTQGMMAQNIRS